MSEITLTRDQFTHDEWKDVCYAADVPTYAVSITIAFDEGNVTYEEE